MIGRALNEVIRPLPKTLPFRGMTEDAQALHPSHRRGGIKQIREHGWRVDVELPRDPFGRRRRVSKTVAGTFDDAEAALEKPRAEVDGMTTAPTTRRRRPGAPNRARQYGAMLQLSPDRWLVGVEGPPDPMSGDRRGHTRTVRGPRDQAEVTLARLKLEVDSGEVLVGTQARTLQAACDTYLVEARTESQTVRTDRSAAHRICATVLPGGARAGELPLSKMTWKVVEQIFSKWDGAIHPTTQARYASTLSKVLEHAKRIGWIRSNPVTDAKRPKVPTHRPDVPMSAEVRDALRRAKATDFVLYVYVTGLATIGCRRSELLAITVGDLDLEAGVVTIKASIADGGPGRGIYRKSTKRDDWRDVPLTPQMLEVFEELLIRRTESLAQFGKPSLDPEGYVFSDDVDGASVLRPDTMSHRWLAERGPNRVTFAMLRRYVATQLLDVTNGDYRTVASITGNSEETLRRWYDAGPNLQKKQAVIQMARL